MEFNAEHLKNIYEAIKEKRNVRDEYINQVQKLDNDISKEILEYRIESVKRVLDYIHSKLYTNKEINLDTLITHCCNKLNGNIDGIELKLDDRYGGK